jgi:hypothetical protein
MQLYNYSSSYRRDTASEMLHEAPLQHCKKCKIRRSRRWKEAGRAIIRI